MASKSEDDQFAVADLVHDDAANDDAKAEASEARSADSTELSGSEAELLAPVVKDAATDGKAYASSKDGHEASPE